MQTYVHTNLQIVWYIHSHTFAAIFVEIFATFRPKSCQRFVVCFTVLCSVMWASLNALWLPQFHISSSIHRVFLPSSFFSSNNIITPPPLPHAYVYTRRRYICNIRIYFIISHCFCSHSHPSNEKSNVSFIAWSMLLHSHRHHPHHQKNCCTFV